MELLGVLEGQVNLEIQTCGLKTFYTKGMFSASMFCMSVRLVHQRTAYPHTTVNKQHA